MLLAPMTMRPRGSLRLAAWTALGLALICPVAPACAASASATGAAPSLGGLSVRPVGADGRPTRGSYVDVAMARGARRSARLAVRNGGDRPIRLLVDRVDGLANEGGGMTFSSREGPRTADGRWLRPGDTELTLGPGERRVVPVRISVPSDARPGDHVGGIAVQPVDPTRPRGALVVTQRTRVVVAVRVRVTGPARRRMAPAVGGFVAGPESGRPALMVRLANTGERLCRPSVRVRVYGAVSGRLVASEQRAIDTVPARATAPVPVTVRRPITPGSYRAVVRTRGCGPDAYASAVVRLDSATPGAAPSGVAAVVEEPGAASGGLTGWRHAAALVAAALGAAALPWLLCVLRRRMRGARQMA